MIPEKCDLLELLAEIKDMWYPVGEMLGVGRAHLEGVRCSNLPDNERLSAILQYWMDAKSSPVTWGIILKALRSGYIDQLPPGLADKIQHRLADKIQHRLATCVTVTHVQVSAAISDHTRSTSASTTGGEGIGTLHYITYVLH